MGKKKTDLTTSTTPKTPYDGLVHWTWPLPFHRDASVDAFLDSFLGLNEGGANVSLEARRDFMAAMRSSVSLNHVEKRQVVLAYPTLSKFQFTELLKTWEEERDKFTVLEEDHPEDMAKLFAKMEFEWAILINPDHGALAYFSRYLFDERTALPIEALTDNASMYTHVLNQNERFDEVILLVTELLKRNPEMEKSDRIDLINSGLHAMSRSGLVKNEHEIRMSFIFSEIKTLQGDDGAESSGDAAFLDFCSLSYLMDVQGLTQKRISQTGKELCTAYKKAGARIPDLSSQMSTYFMLSGDFTAALSAAEICLKRYNPKSDFSINNRHIMNVAKNGGKSERLNTNIIRNSIRYLLLLSRFGGEAKRNKKYWLIGEFFKNTIEHFNEWRSDKHTNHLSLFIVMYFFAEDDHLKNDNLIRRHIDGPADLYEKFLYRLAFSHPVRGGILDGLKSAMHSIDGKAGLITFSLSVQAICFEKISLEEDKRFVSEEISKIYTEVVREKGWNENKESGLFRYPTIAVPRQKAK